MFWDSRRGSRDSRRAWRSRGCCWGWGRGLGNHWKGTVEASHIMIKVMLVITIQLGGLFILVFLLQLLDVDVLPNKRYTSFMPSLEDQGQFEIIWDQINIRIPGMMIGMGKRSSWERSDLPWPKRWYSSAGAFSPHSWGIQKMCQGKNKKFSNFQSFGTMSEKAEIIACMQRIFQSQ